MLHKHKKVAIHPISGMNCNILWRMAFRNMYYFTIIFSTCLQNCHLRSSRTFCAQNF